MSEIVIGATGHKTLSHDETRIREELKKIFIAEAPKHTITGMALGYDMLFAEVSLELGIPFVAAVPFEEQAAMWPEHEQKRYLDLISKAKDIYIHPQTVVGNKVYAGYFGRNKWIVQNSQLIVAYMINDKDGGTAHTWNQAMKQGVRAINLVDKLKP